MSAEPASGDQDGPIHRRDDRRSDLRPCRSLMRRLVFDEMSCGRRPGSLLLDQRSQFGSYDADDAQTLQGLAVHPVLMSQ
jgi:hypothetical protein